MSLSPDSSLGLGLGFGFGLGLGPGSRRPSADYTPGPQVALAIRSTRRTSAAIDRTWSGVMA